MIKAQPATSALDAPGQVQSGGLLNV